jgi:hypothetical protein
VWPELDSLAWDPTRQSLHRYAQMLGKLRVALSPDQPNWIFSALALTARGFTTGPMPWHDGAVEVALDVFASSILIASSDGNSAEVPLLPPTTVADVYARLSGALAKLGIDAVITTVPQEMTDLTPLDSDRRPAEYDPAAVQRWFAATTAAAGVFDDWRAHFFGRSGIYLWWGGFDLSLMLFNGKHAEAPRDRGYLMRYDLDAELMNAGFYPGGDYGRAPFFFGYVHPPPPGSDQLPRAPAAARWSSQLGEWILPYEAVRSAADPGADLRAFLDSVYAAATGAGGWDRTALSYEHPPRHKR